MQNMLSQPFEGPIAWKADTLLPNDGLVTIDAACQQELSTAVDVLRANPLDVISLIPDDFEMPACRSMMARVKETLDDGIGFVILDRLPVEGLTEQESKGLYWLLMSILGKTVAQNFNGVVLYDVVDTGQKTAPGKGVRGSKTNQGQGYHTDNSYGLPPNYVSLFCLREAMEGGISGLISFYTAHNILLKECPDLLSRLYESFYFERHREHAPDDNPVSVKPIFEYDGNNLGVSLSTDRVRSGYALLEKPLDNETTAALAGLDEVLERPGLGKSFAFERGQIQIVNNRKLGHRRTAFKDWPEEDRKRHLVRIWVRNHGRRFYLG